MKKIILTLSLLMLTTLFLKAQTTKVLYFKADLSCCMAKSCEALQYEISDIVKSNFGNSVSFEVKKTSDPSNSELISKYNAKSQTVIIEKYDKKGKLVESADISAEVKTFAYNKDKIAFTEILKNKIN